MCYRLRGIVLQKKMTLIQYMPVNHFVSAQIGAHTYPICGWINREQTKNSKMAKDYFSGIVSFLTAHEYSIYVYGDQAAAQMIHIHSFAPLALSWRDGKQKVHC